MTISARRGMLTKAVATLRETVVSFTASISELHANIREKEPVNNDNFLPLGKEQLPVYTDEAVLFHALITMYHDGSSSVILDSERVEKAIASLRAECLINGKEPTTYPDDVNAAEIAARATLDMAETVWEEWDAHAALVSQWYSPQRNPANDSAQSANQAMNQQTGSHSASANPFQLQMYEMLKGIQSTMSALKSRIERLETTNRTQSSVNDNSVIDNNDYDNSFEYSTFASASVERNTQLNHHPHQSPVLVAPVSSHPQAIPMANQTNIRQHEFTTTRQPVNVQPNIVQQHTMQSHNMQPHFVTSQSVNNMYNQSLLPPLQAQCFNGQRTSYEEFKAVFEITIGGNVYIQDRQKLLYLKGLLPHQDKSTISRYPLSDEGYSLAWQFLDRKYGNTSDVAEELLAQLKNQTAANNSLQANKDMWLEAQSIVAQLELIEPLEPRLVNDIILRHFSPELRREIYLSFTENTIKSWTEFRDITDRIIMKRETAERRDSLYSHVTAQSIPRGSSSTSRSSAPMQKTYKCFYCESVDHYSSDCTVIPLEERNEFLRNNGRCENCAGKGHTLDRCTSVVTCLKCNGKHHISLSCPEHSNLVHMNIVQCRKPNFTGCGRPGGRKPRQDNPSRCPILHTLPILYSKLAGLDESVPILLDSGAQLSLIEESLVKKLHLPIHSSSTLHVRGFQSEVTTVKSHVVSIEMIGPSNFNLAANICTMTDMLAPISVTAPTKNDKKFLRQHGLELPQPFPAKVVQPLIIIGMDILWQILDGLKVTNLPSGNSHSNTKLGSVITGPTMSTAKTSVVGQYHLLVAQEQAMKQTRESQLSKLSDNYRIAVDTVQGLRKFSQFAKSLYPDLSDKYKTYKEKDGTTETRSTLKSSIEKCPPGAPLASGRVCYADTTASVGLASSSQTTTNQTPCLREIHRGKYHHSSQYHMKIQRQKNLPEKMSQSGAEGISRLSNATPHTIPHVTIFSRSFTNTAYRRSPNHSNKEVIVQINRTTNRPTQPPQTNLIYRSPQSTKEIFVPTSGSSPRKKGRIRDDDPRR